MKRWLHPLALLATAGWAGYCAGRGLLRIVNYVAWRSGCEVCLRATDITPSIWTLSLGALFVVLALLWLTAFARHVLRLARERERQPLPLLATLAALGIFAWTAW
jgi:hypothetical protein